MQKRDAGQDAEIRASVLAWLEQRKDNKANGYRSESRSPPGNRRVAH